MHSASNDLTPCLGIETADFPLSVKRKIKADKEALFPILPHHYRLERVNVRTANLFALLYLNRIPFIHESKLILACSALRDCGNGIDSPINPHVPDLFAVWSSADSNYSPILEFKRRELAELLFRPRQVTDNKP